MANFDGTNSSRVPSIKKHYPILSRSISRIYPHLDNDVIIMHLIEEGCLSIGEEYDRINKVRTNGTRLQATTDIIMLIEKRQGLESFKRALEKSSREIKAHEDILKMIREEQTKYEEKESSSDVTETDHTIHGRIQSDPVVPTLELAEIGNLPPQPVTQVAVEPPVDEPGEPPSCSSFVLGGLCVVLALVVAALAAGGIALMVFAGQGFGGSLNCNITNSVNQMTSRIETNSILWFNLASGFLCLVLPVTFILLMIHAVCVEFSGKGYDKTLGWKVLWIVIISYVAVSIVIAVAQLGLSIYVATLIYPAYDRYLGSMVTTPGFNGTSEVESSAAFNCDQTVYLSAFICLTVFYIVIFLALAIFTGWWFANSIRKAVNYVLDNYERCLKSIRGNREQEQEVNVPAEGAPENGLLATQL